MSFGPAVDSIIMELKHQMDCDVISDALNQLGLQLKTLPASRQKPPGAAVAPEWSGAGIQITSLLIAARLPASEGCHITIASEHAPRLAWLMCGVRDAFAGYLDADNKEAFFLRLAVAARNSLKAGKGETGDACVRAQKAMLEVARTQLLVLRSKGRISCSPNAAGCVGNSEPGARS